MNLPTRREILQQAICVPIATCLPVTCSAHTRLQIIREPNCLSEESAEGFRSLLRPAHDGANIVVLCSIADLRQAHAVRLREQAADGAWIVFESSPTCSREQREVLTEAFGIRMREPIAVSTDQLYIRYRWPHVRLTRAFSAVTPVACPEAQAIAHYAGIPVGMKRRIGRGGIVFLGSMLGPNLRAEEREARELGRRMLDLLGHDA